MALIDFLMSCRTFPVNMFSAIAEFLNILVFHSFHRIQAITPGIRFQALLTKGLEDMEDLPLLSESWMEFLSLLDCLKTRAMSSHIEQVVVQVLSM